ncbi:hypothetical protein [Streptomyces sp. DH10]|uniref:hypothetical protein n=1 Tax=Streptomyces sp. DH10 TaxID=3040121 RepID=UPI0024413558|nr:hypothetical protein [Streptomyces sp. DH10]MDG9713393.1 hypothetical protein [Streptomyces sp. DH10]
MRIRSVLAAVVLTAAVTAAGAATAHAGDDGPGHHNGKHHIPCSPYFGELEAETAGIEWGGAVCYRGVFDL